jgi:hypothetical protein
MAKLVFFAVVTLALIVLPLKRITLCSNSVSVSSSRALSMRDDRSSTTN